MNLYFFILFIEIIFQISKIYKFIKNIFKKLNLKIQFLLLF
jgi:hypothetical protein